MYRGEILAQVVCYEYFITQLMYIPIEGVQNSVRYLIVVFAGLSKSAKTDN